MCAVLVIQTHAAMETHLTCKEHGRLVTNNGFGLLNLKQWVHTSSDDVAANQEADKWSLQASFQPCLDELRWRWHRWNAGRRCTWYSNK